MKQEKLRLFWSYEERNLFWRLQRAAVTNKDRKHESHGIGMLLVAKRGIQECPGTTTDDRCPIVDFAGGIAPEGIDSISDKSHAVDEFRMASRLSVTQK